MIHLPYILLEIPRNVVTAVGLPLSLGLLSITPNYKMPRDPWYQALRKPRFAPPGIAFPIVWPILYICMGYSSHLAVSALDTAITTTEKDNASLAMTLYYTHLALNYSWMPVFFWTKRLGVSFVHILTVTATTYYMTKLLHDLTDGEATKFLTPLCGWLTYATYLSGSLWWRNSVRNTSKKN